MVLLYPKKDTYKVTKIHYEALSITLLNKKTYLPHNNRTKTDPKLLQNNLSN